MNIKSVSYEHAQSVHTHVKLTRIHTRLVQIFTILRTRVISAYKYVAYIKYYKVMSIQLRSTKITFNVRELFYFIGILKQKFIFWELRILRHFI